MATAHDVLTAVRATLSTVSGLIEAQQVQDEHRAAPELDRTWSCEARETTTTEGRVRGVRHMFTRLSVVTAHRVRTPGPQRSVLDVVGEEETTRAALETTTATGVSGVRVDRINRTLTGDRQYHLTTYDLTCTHTA